MTALSSFAHPRDGSPRRLAPRVVLAVPLVVYLALGAGIASPSSGSDERPWGTDLNAALSQATASGKPILVDLFAEWCGWCKTLEAKVFPTAIFREFSDGMILLRVDTEDDGQGAMLYQRFGITQLPTLLVMDDRMALIATIEGYAAADAYVARARNEMAKYDTYLARVGEALLDTTPEARRRAVVEEARQRADGRRAVAILERLTASSTASPLFSADLVALADAHRIDREFVRAESVARRARGEAERRGDRANLERADLLLASIRHESGQCQEAKLAFESFLKVHPRSRFSAYAEHVLGTIAKTPVERCA